MAPVCQRKLLKLGEPTRRNGGWKVAALRGQKFGPEVYPSGDAWPEGGSGEDGVGGRDRLTPYLEEQMYRRALGSWRLHPCSLKDSVFPEFS